MATSNNIAPVPPLPGELDQLARWLDQLRSRVSTGSGGSDYINVKDSPYNAKGDGVTDDSAAIQAALTYATTNGGTVFFPSGSYVCATPLVLDNTATGPVFTGPRCNIMGSGSANTRLIYPSGSGSLLTIGNAQLQYHITISGLYLEGPGGGTPGTGTAMTVDSALFFSLQDVRVTGFALGMTGTDIYNLYIANSTFAYNVAGMDLQVGTYTHPNADTFVATTFAYNTNYGLFADLAVTLSFFGGTFQGNGIGGSGAFVGGVRITNGTDGAAGCNFQGTYFEENAGTADIYLEGSYDATNSITGCTFNRITSAHYTTNNILVSAAAGKTNRLSVNGCGFSGFGSYVANAGRMYMAISGTGSPQISWMGCYFQSATEKPTYATLLNYITLGDGAINYQTLGDVVRGVALNPAGSGTATIIANAPITGTIRWLAISSDSLNPTVGYVPILY